MKKIIPMAAFAVAMLVTTTTVAQAQDQAQRAGRGMRANPVTIVKDSIKASDDVVAKVDSIWKAYQGEQQSLMEAARGGDADARTKLGAERTKAMDAIKALLTDEQKAQFDKLMPARRRGGGGR